MDNFFSGNYDSHYEALDKVRELADLGIRCLAWWNGNDYSVSGHSRARYVFEVRRIPHMLADPYGTGKLKMMYPATNELVISPK